MALVQGLGFGVSGFRFQGSGFGFRVPGFGFRVSIFEIRVSSLGFGSRIWGFGLRVLMPAARGLHHRRQERLGDRQPGEPHHLIECYEVQNSSVPGMQGFRGESVQGFGV